MSDHYPALVRYCAYQDRCKADVIQKMDDIGVPDAEREGLLLQLQEENYLNEQRFLGSYIRGKHNHNGWGRLKISYYLRQKGFSTSEISVALKEEITEEAYQIAIANRIDKLMRMKKYDHLKAYQYEITTAIVKMGYEPDLVRKVLDSLTKL